MVVAQRGDAGHLHRHRRGRRGRLPAFNADALGYASDDATSDALVAVVENLANGTFSAFEPLNGQTALDAETAPFRTNVMVLPVRAVDIGLSDADTGFDYRVETWAGERLEPVEVTPVLHYDVRTAGLDLVGRGGTGAVLCGRARRP
ncbi:MAG: hypothetical protein R2851_16020 [Caldilineaceae bacterium]